MRWGEPRWHGHRGGRTADAAVPTRWVGVRAELFRSVPEVQGQHFREGEAEQLQRLLLRSGGRVRVAKEPARALALPID